MDTKNDKFIEGSEKELSTDMSLLKVTEMDTSFSFNKLLKDVASQSLKALKWFSLVALAFSLPNIIFIIISAIKENNNILASIITLLITLIFFTISLYSTYKYLLIDTLSIGYKYLTPLFRKICVTIIDKIVASGNLILGKRDINKIVNVGALMIEIYGKKLPSYLQKAVIFVLKRIPFSDFLFNMQKDIQAGQKDRKDLSEILYLQLDNYVNNSFFMNNSMKWLTWLLSINILIQILSVILL